MKRFQNCFPDLDGSTSLRKVSERPCTLFLILIRVSVRFFSKARGKRDVEGEGILFGVGGILPAREDNKSQSGT